MNLKTTGAKIYESARLLYGVKDRKYYNESADRCEQLHNIHFGASCFIIGTGPSLSNTNFKPIKNKILFGVNKLFIDMDKFGIHSQYWCVADPNIFRECYQDLLNLNTTMFLTNGATVVYLKEVKKYTKEIMIPIVLKPLSDMKTTQEFSTDITKGVNGGMVTLSCLQIAYYLGFKDVYLVGCDCSQKGNHYYNTIYTKEDDWEIFFKLYEKCKQIYEQQGRKIYNATVGGNLEVFERVRLEEIK